MWGGGYRDPLGITPAQAALMPTSTRSRQNRGVAGAIAVVDAHVSEPDSENAEALLHTHRASVGAAVGGGSSTATVEVSSTVRHPNTPYHHSVREQ